jgi:hypothetical protein
MECQPPSTLQGAAELVVHLQAGLLNTHPLDLLFGNENVVRTIHDHPNDQLIDNRRFNARDRIPRGIADQRIAGKYGSGRDGRRTKAYRSQPRASCATA